MSNRAQTPRTQSGGELQAIRPGACITGAPVIASNDGKVTLKSVGSEGVYVFCDALIHLKFSKNGQEVDDSYPPIDARGGTVLACDVKDRVSFMKKAGEEDALIWICPLGT